MKKQLFYSFKQFFQKPNVHIVFTYKIIYVSLLLLLLLLLLLVFQPILEDVCVCVCVSVCVWLCVCKLMWTNLPKDHLQETSFQLKKVFFVSL